MNRNNKEGTTEINNEMTKERQEEEHNK